MLTIRKCIFFSQFRANPHADKVFKPLVCCRGMASCLCEEVTQLLARACICQVIKLCEALLAESRRQWLSYDSGTISSVKLSDFAQEAEGLFRAICALKCGDGNVQASPIQTKSRLVLFNLDH